MPHRVTQPSKEQVRAYMAARVAARASAASSGGRPPPSPEEIRALLGWRLLRTDPAPFVLQFYLIPTAYSRLATTLACDFLLAAMKIPYVACITQRKFT